MRNRSHATASMLLDDLKEYINSSERLRNRAATIESVSLLNATIAQNP